MPKYLKGGHMPKLILVVLLSVLILLALLLMAINIIWFALVKPAADHVLKVSARIINDSPYSS